MTRHYASICSSSSATFIGVLIASVVVLALLHFDSVNAADTCTLGGVRDDCCPGGCSQNECEQNLGCCYDPISPQGIPWCFKPNPIVSGYRVNSVQSTSNGLVLTLQTWNPANYYTPDIAVLKVFVYMETDTRLHVKIVDPNNQRWEVPLVVRTTTPANKATAPLYSFSYTTQPFGFAVTRTSDGAVLFNSTSPSPTSSTWSTDKIFNGLIFENQYLEISTQLPPSPNIYGLGEHVHSLRLTPHQVYTMFAADRGTQQDINLYGVHPFYMDLRTTEWNGGGSAHGVFLVNSNGQEVYLGDNSLTWRTVGGVLDMYFFLGPNPADVVAQYTQVVGRPYMPPYWSLGWHQCRWGYHTIQDVIDVVSNYSANNIPLETMWSDIDYMEKYLDFTFSPTRFPVDQMAKFVDKLHNNGQHYVVINDCGIANATNYGPWTDGINDDIFIKDAQGKPFMGKVWPGATSWPDFLNPKTQQYWTTQIKGFLDSVPLDGLWDDMNEISNFCDGECPAAKTPGRPGDYNNPPYAINNGGSRQALNIKTTDMTVNHYGGVLEYDAHSLFGSTEANQTRVSLEAVTNKRAFVLSRSSFSGHGSYAFHWLGDNTSDWPDLYFAIPGILNFNIFGVPMVGADICGFNGASNQELCARWMEVGVFYPFSRNHNAIGEPSQEPYVWPLVANISRKVINAKYSLIPYYYTLFHVAHELGGTVARPMFFEFPGDFSTVDIDAQFMIGSGLLITPVLEQGATTVTGYFPGPDPWYDFWTFAAITFGSSQTLTLPTPIDHIQVHVRGGNIIPQQQPAYTLRDARKNPYSLIVALSGVRTAVGWLFLDDGETLNTVQKNQQSMMRFNANANNTITATVEANNYAPASSLPLSTVSILGVTNKPNTVRINVGSVQNVVYNSTTQTVVVSLSGVSIVSAWTLAWA